MDMEQQIYEILRPFAKMVAEELANMGYTAARIADQLLAAARMPAILCTRPHAFSQDHLTELTGAAGH